MNHPSEGFAFASLCRVSVQRFFEPTVRPVASKREVGNGGQRMSGLVQQGIRRRAVFAAVLLASAVALAVFAAGAGAQRHGPPPWTPAALLDKARANPASSFQVIVRGRPGP